MKKILIIAFAAFVLASCGDKEKFSVEGNITNAQDSVLYFESIGLEEIAVVDSVVLDKDGAFTFSDKKQETPEFYRLRIYDQIINVCVDSTETITVNADYKKMATDYTIEGNQDCKEIKALTLSQIELQNRIIALTKDMTVKVSDENDSIQHLIDAYKDNVKMNYIFKNPDHASSYFALFQTIGGYLMFKPSDSGDNKAFAAVATCWDTFYPESPRGRNLHNITIDGMNNKRIIAARQNATIDPSIIEETTIIDIALPDNKGGIRKLTDLKGKVVLLNFNIFNTSESPAIVMKLRELYDKYHGQGLEIYQVSLDSDEHRWKTSTASLPWINVRDEEGEYSHYAVSYNVQSATECFLIDRNNALDTRHNLDDVEARIQALLR